MSSTGFGLGGRDDAIPQRAAVRDAPVYRSTAEDYLRFAEMLRNGGVHQGNRLLSNDAVRRMTTNQVGSLCPRLNGREPARGIGFGFSVAVVEDPVAAGESLPAGTSGWDGIDTRRFWVSPTGGWSLFLYAPDVSVQREIETTVTAALA